MLSGYHWFSSTTKTLKNVIVSGYIHGSSPILSVYIDIDVSVVTHTSPSSTSHMGSQYPIYEIGGVASTLWSCLFFETTYSSTFPTLSTPQCSIICQQSSLKWNLTEISPGVSFKSSISPSEPLSGTT